MGDFVGTGWSFPPEADGRGGIALVSGPDNVARAIQIILGTPLGQRVMRPTFGCRLQELVFAPLNPETLGIAELYVQEALTFWEPRIELLDVIAQIAPEQPAMMLITINYVIKATHDRRSLVYPFYQIPGD